jgi:hypothetical protein
MPSTSPHLTIGGVDCTIRLDDLGDRAIVEGIGEDGSPTASVHFKCSYADRYTLFRAMKGTSVKNGTQIVRTIPYQYPPSPNLYCLSISDVTGIKPRTTSTGWVIFEYAVFTANFGVPKYQYDLNAPGGQNDPSGQPWTTTKFKVSAEVVSPPGGAFYIGPFPGASLAEESAIGIIRANCEVSITRRFVPYVPLDAVMGLVAGAVNSEPITFSDHVFPIGTLLFAGLESEPSNDPAGNPTQELHYTYLGKDDDWNKVISKDGSLQFLNTAADGSGQGPYAYLDFSILP